VTEWLQNVATLVNSLMLHCLKKQRFEFNYSFSSAQHKVTMNMTFHRIFPNIIFHPIKFHIYRDMFQQNEDHYHSYQHSCLSSVMVSVLAIGPKVHGSKPVKVMDF
jgi:hypothetical protein